ncbi:uncharacterized protein LOC129585448 isoform X2 [Paramacrobiotus metropolitanus]|uniref:uncharacterized protein LOC129585448 isoform X2 n=1 Tax=Paramacrobiotus metropolitanus TaxID=2943436 RepID=UPI002445DBC0|nr:uncharacterized protein LOC129585448 isoform X2 [Paramacrobiotus metropolitanus]
MRRKKRFLPFHFPYIQDFLDLLPIQQASRLRKMKRRKQLNVSCLFALYRDVGNLLGMKRHSRHFSPKNFFEATSVKPRRMRRNALPSQIDCVAEYRALRNSGELVGREAVQTCCVCECRRPLDENDLIPSERLSFFPFPDDNILRDSWLTACRQWNPNLTVSKESVICENHFSLDDLTQLLEDDKEARWVPKSEAVPTFAELPVPVKLKKNNRGIRTRSTNTSGWCTGYKCCVPGCGNRSQVEGKLEKITFHIIPGLGTSSRFCEWMNRIRCAISWKPDRHSRVCSKHFCPEDFVEETSKGKQPRTNYLKKLVVPSRLQCVEKFRSPADLSEPVEISAVHRCCVCGWWRSTREKYVRSEVLTFFPFPSDDDQREQWVNICQEWNPDFVFSEELLVCENHFQLDELTWICVDQVNKQLKLRSDAVPSERCLRFLTPSDDTSARDDAVEGEAGASFDGLFGLSSLIRDADTAAEDASEAGSDTGVCEGRGDVSAYENAWGTYMTDDDNSLMEVDNTDLPVTDIINSICPPLKRRRNVENGLPADEDCTNVSVGSIHGMPSALTFASKDAMEISARFASPARCSTDDALMCKNGTSSSEAACVSRLPGESGSSLPATAADGYRRTDENSRVRSKKKRTNKTGNFFTSNICSECNTRFRKEGMLRLHLLGHTGYADPPERKCPECLKHFDDFPALLKHVDEHGTLLVQCPVCNETCSSGVILVHLHRYHPGFEIKRRKLHQKRLNCDTCGLRFARNFLYRLHQLGHQDKECVDNIKITRKCPECGEMFESLEKLAVHVDVHGKPTKKCPVCNGYYPGMRKHIARYHPHYLAETSCSECGKEYTNESSLRLHLRGHQIRASLDSWTCHKCRLQFPKDSLFVLHKNSHSTAACNAISGAQRCPECDEEFDAMDPLHQHVLTHAVAAQKCPECGHWFPCHRLRKHMKWHHPARAHLSILQEKGYRTHPGYKENYKCLKCGQRFRLRRHLEQHMLGHRHRVPFQKTICVQCGLHFRTHLLCRIHKYEHGGKEIAEDIRNRTTCEECVEEFEDFGALVKHVSVHGRRTEECPVCKGRFHALNSHIQRHHPECQYRSGKDCGHVPYRCGECGKEFEALDAFTGHVVAHRAKSALVARTCSDCGLRFKTDIACRLHKMQHGNGEPTALLRDTRECPECQQNFDRLDELVEHVSEHGRATTKCPECGDWYAVVTAHIRRDHPDYHRKLLGLNKSGSENDRSDEDVDLKPKIQMPRMQRRIRFED